MKVDGKSFRTIWLASDGWAVEIIDQTRLPHEFKIKRLESVDDVAVAIKDMWVRGAPLIGATAAYGVALAMNEDPSDQNIDNMYDQLISTRPTAVNLRWALDNMRDLLKQKPEEHRILAAYERAKEISDDDVQICSRIGNHGAKIISELAEQRKNDGVVNILTHCNAGWLATVDWGTALAPIYKAHDAGIAVHVWVDETRPRNQGASLTAWELGQHGVSHTVVVDNVGGHLMQHGMVDLVITGTDRTTYTGDVCNKIGTYLKALAAKDNGIPFYVGLPSSTIDWTVEDGVLDIPIEERQSSEVSLISGKNTSGDQSEIQITPDDTPVANYAFDVTPRRLITGLITERGVSEANEEGLKELFPEFG
ncbi:MAG: S-methyl-5-thioribose-1-phosphate isomerase [Pseudomonadota bacterium]|nr:S-methyl-5-thioribose-1-phosphate isomerase [Pseudomonadota bacterium]